MTLQQTVPSHGNNVKKTYGLMVFDLDGTLVDSKEDLAASVNHVRSLYSLPSLSLDTIRAYVGDGIRVLMERALPGFSQEKLDTAVKRMRSYYAEHLLVATKPYAGVAAVLEQFKDRRMAILTNKPEQHSRLILEGLGLAKYFSLVWGGDTGPQRKPDPAPLREILKHFSVEPDDAVMIGDGLNDVRAAKAAGIHCIALTYGYTPAAALRQLHPDALASSPEELLNIIA